MAEDYFLLANASCLYPTFRVILLLKMRITSQQIFGFTFRYWRSDAAMADSASI